MKLIAGVWIVGAVAVAAVVLGLAVVNPWTLDTEAARTAPGEEFHPEVLPSSEDGAAPSYEPLDLTRFNGTLQASVGSPTGHVILGPTSDNHVEFDVGPKGNYLVAEVAWDSEDIQDLGAVLWVQRDTGLGYVAEATTLDLEYVAEVTGPSPLYLATPIEPDARYSWWVYPLPRQVIVHLDFESAISAFETRPPGDYRVFSPLD